MALPKRLAAIADKIKPATDAEERLLSTLVKRLEHSLSVLRKSFGSDCDECFEQAVDCIFSEGASTCLDWYEECMEKRMVRRRGVTEAEEAMAGELLSHVTGITELLLTLGGIELAEVEEPEAEDGSGGR